MGKRAGETNDRAIAKEEGDLAGSAETPWFSFVGPFNLWVWGVAGGSIALEASFDGGTTIFPVLGTDGTPQTFSAAGRIVLDEPESGITYRLNATGLTGTAHWRFSK